MSAIASFINHYRIDHESLMKNVSWTPCDNGDMSGTLPECSRSQKIFENLATRRGDIIIGIATIALAIAIIASIGASIGAFLAGGVIGLVGVAILGYALLRQPNVLVGGDLFVAPWLVRAVGEETIRKAPITTNSSELKGMRQSFALTRRFVYAGFGSLLGGTNYERVTDCCFKYMLHEDGEDVAKVVVETLGISSGIDPEYESFGGDQIGTTSDLAAVGWSIAAYEPSSADLAIRAKIANRIQRLINGERLGRLDSDGVEQAVTETSYIEKVIPSADWL